MVCALAVSGKGASPRQPPAVATGRVFNGYDCGNSERVTNHAAGTNAVDDRGCTRYPHVPPGFPAVAERGRGRKPAEVLRLRVPDADDRHHWAFSRRRTDRTVGRHRPPPRAR